MDVFISHASEDKEEVARPLARQLQNLGIRVWFDEHTLRLGDSLPEKIDEGLFKCRFGVVILSAHFFSKDWPRRELDALVNLEVIRKEKLIFPVWHRISAEEVAKFSPALASRYAVSTDHGISSVVAAILFAIELVAPEKSADLSQYEILRTVSQSHYGKVFKCRSCATGQLCIVKETEADRVSLNTLRALNDITANIAKPVVVWEQDNKVYEELPYIGGIRLSQAVIPGFGGLTGCVLESFDEQMRATLRTLHASGIVHRDIHPSNIFMTQHQVNRDAPWQADQFGYFALNRFYLSWVIVDCTFASLLTEPSRARYRHGPYTPDEQAVGAAIPASDMYAFGATLYYCIEGKEIPSYQQRRHQEPLPLHGLESYHPSRDFDAYLENLLALNAVNRATTDVFLEESTTIEGYTGVLRMDEGSFLVCNTSHGYCQILSAQELVRLIEDKEVRLFSKLRESWPRLKQAIMANLSFP
jgi:hypothetical protein